MENSPGFELNQAIGRWRERLAGLRSFGADDLEELENHLRESIVELQAQGLSVEEAFLVGTERLGSDCRLAQEYAKANAKRIWNGRAAWMLGGVVAGLAMKALVETGLGLVYHVNLWLGLSARLLVMADFFTQWTINAGCIGLGYWLLVRRKGWSVDTLNKCFRRPVWMGLAVVLGVFALQLVPGLILLWMHRTLPVASVSPADRAIFRTWGFAAMLLSRLVWVAAIPLLAAYLWKATRAATSSMPPLPDNTLQPNERALVTQLEARGFSRSESHFVIAWRRGYRPPSEAKRGLAPGIWLECGFWMIVGMVAHGILREFIDEPSWMLMPSGRALPPLWQHLGGLISMCLPVALAAGAVAVFWRGATGSLKRSGWLRRLFQQSPVRAATLFATLAVLWIAVTACLVLVRPADAQPPILSLSRIGVIWWTCRVLLVEFLLPAILLVWVGNRYQAVRKCA